LSSPYQSGFVASAIITFGITVSQLCADSLSKEYFWIKSFLFVVELQDTKVKIIAKRNSIFFIFPPYYLPQHLLYGLPLPHGQESSEFTFFTSSSSNSSTLCLSSSVFTATLNKKDVVCSLILLIISSNIWLEIILYSVTGSL